MTNIIRAALAVLSSAALSACNEPPVSVSQTNNSNFRVDVLFEHDGCRVNRFYDGGRHIYFVTCPSGRPAQTSWHTRHSCGKNCWTTKAHNVTTSEGSQW